MTSTAVFSAAPALNSPLFTINNRLLSPMPFPYSYDSSPTIRYANNKSPNPPHHRIKSSASDSMSNVNTPTAASASKEEEEEENPVKIGARVRVKVPLTVYHIPREPEVELNGKEGKIKENVVVWKGKQISANFPYKIEFLEIVEGRGDAPVKFFAHLREDEFEYIQ